MKEVVGAIDEADPAEALRAIEARLDLATRAAGIGVWDWNAVTGRMVYSSRAKAICGFAPDQEVTFEMAGAIVHPEDYPRTSAMAKRALDPALREREPYEYRVVLPDGSIRWVLAHGEAVFGPDGKGGHKALRYVGTIQDVTELREMEAARQASDRRLRLAVEAGRMAVWEVEIEGERLIGSPELNRLLGFPEDETLDIEEVRRRYFPGERERLRRIGQEVMERGERFLETEFRYRHPDGTPRWLMLRAELQFGADGQPERALGVLVDVTESRRTAEALRTSEARVKLALKAAGAGTWDLDLDRGQLAWSPEIYEHAGIDPATPQERLFDAWREAVHPDDRARFGESLAEARANGGGLTLEYRVVPAGGEVRWMRSHGIAVPGPDGEVSRLTGINLDISEERRESERLRLRAEETERERARIYELSHDLLAVANFEGYLTAVNPAWERLLGLSRQELVSVPFIERIHPEDRARTAETVGRLRHGAEVRHFDTRVLAAEGRILSISWSAVAEGDHFYAIGRDVTREKEREEALRQAQKMEAIGQLTGGIAHDFNNLLQAVQGNFDLIVRRAGDERVKRWAEQGREAADRGARLTKQLLAFSRAQKLELKPVDVPALVRGMEEIVGRTLGPQIRVSLELGEGAGTVRADATQLEMALLNLAINARDAMPEGGTLTLRTAAERRAGDAEIAAGDYLRIELADSGEGMPREVAERAFDPFFTTKGPGRGTGLGLSQVYGMARQAGGTAAIASAPGEGTIVSLLLPLTDAPAPAGEAESGDSATAPPGSATVLVVDDDGDVRRFLVDTLTDLGYRAIEAEGGAEALERVSDTVPDVIIVDFAMPNMNGAEVAEKVRALRPDLPILFASGYADTAALDAAAGPGAVLLRKPFRIAELESALAEALKRGLPET